MDETDPPTDPKFTLPLTPGSVRIATAFEKVAAAADELDAAVAVNRQQVTDNNEHVSALNFQSSTLTEVADRGASVAANLRSLLQATPPAPPAAG